MVACFLHYSTEKQICFLLNVPEKQYSYHLVVSIIMAEQKYHVEYRACGGAERTFTNEIREMLTQSECSLNIKTKVKVLVA